MSLLFDPIEKGETDRSLIITPEMNLENAPKGCEIFYEQKSAR